MSYLSRLNKNLSNIPGFRTKQKIVVIESDDWGTIRMPSKQVYDILKSQGVDLDSGDNYRYNHYDTLASAEDFSALFETLSKNRDLRGNTPVFTAISLSANPDFERIRKSGFEKYYYEPFTETLTIYNLEKAFPLWQEGMSKKLFIPQFHGREHLNVASWMRALQKKDQDTMLAFDQQVWGFNNRQPGNISYQAAFDLEEPEDLVIQEQVIKEGLKLFKEIHGFAAEFFVPPNGPFNNSLEKTAAENGIKYMSAAKIQQEPRGNGHTKRVLHWLGQKNKHRQHYITRNCFFEPSDRSKDWVDSCLTDIKTAFRWHKPAVISSHRVNYIGSLEPSNRDHGLRQLDTLLNQILKNWPDVEFMTSTDLGDLIDNGV